MNIFKKMSDDIIYDDNIYVKRNKNVSAILLLKFIMTLPFNVIGIYKPELVVDYPWLLFIEAFHHYHARIFYLLAFHRNITQYYCFMYSNGVVQKKFLLLEALFDSGLVVLYVHEYFRLHNVKAFFSPFSIIHLIIAVLSFYSVLISRKIKSVNIA